MTPWQGQKVGILGDPYSFVEVKPGDFQTVKLPVSRLPIYLATTVVKQPSKFLNSSDDRTLGIAIKEIRVP